MFTLAWQCTNPRLNLLSCRPAVLYYLPVVCMCCGSKSHEESSLLQSSKAWAILENTQTVAVSLILVYNLHLIRQCHLDIPYMLPWKNWLHKYSIQEASRVVSGSVCCRNLYLTTSQIYWSHYAKSTKQALTTSHRITRSHSGSFICYFWLALTTTIREISAGCIWMLI